MDIAKAFELYQSQLELIKKLEPRDQYRLYYSLNEYQVAVGPPWPNIDWEHIEITAEQASNIRRYRLVNGKLHLIDIGHGKSVKYKECATGEYQVAADHLALLIEPGEDYDAVKRVAPDLD